MLRCIAFCFSILNGLVQAQTWIDHGATWHYDIHEMFGSGGFYKYYYSGDTLIDGKLCQRIDGEQHVFSFFPSVTYGGVLPMEPNFTFVSNDTVYYQNNEEFFVLFDFGANIGDSWIISTTNSGSGYCEDTSRVIVTDTSSITMNSNMYRTISLEPVDGSSYGLYGTFNEKFGLISFWSPWHLFPRYIECDTSVIVEWYYLSFKCFEDDSFNMFNPSSEDCEYLLTHLETSENSESLYALYPNPARDKVIIETNEPGILILYNPMGRVVRCYYTESKSELDLSGCSPGMYYLVFESHDARSQIRAIVKQ